MAPESSFGVVFWDIKIAGESIGETALRAGNVELHEYLDDHSSFSIEFLSLAASSESTLENEVLDDLHDKLGQKIELGFGVDGEVSQNWKGTITEIEGRRGYEDGYAVVLKGYGPTKLLDDVPRTRPFVEQKASEAISAVLSDRGLDNSVDSTSTVFPLLLQQDETDYEFIRRLARDEGLWFYYDGEKVRVSAEPSGKGAAATLGSSLASFNIRMSMSSGKAESTAWSYLHSDQVQAKAKESDGEGSHEWQVKAFKESRSEFPDGALVTPPFHPVDTSQLSVWMEARTRAWGASLLTAEGTSFDVGLGLGGKVAVEGAGRSSGDFVIIEIHHGMQEGRRGGYASKFRCLPKEMAHPPSNPDRLRVPQLWGARVLDNVDPDKLGRIKVVLHRSNPADDGQDGQHWVRVSQPFAGAHMGTWWLPEIDDEVVVGCLEGDLQELVCLGSLYHQKTMEVRDELLEAIEQKNMDENAGKLILTRSGNRILLSDVDGNEKIEISSPDAQNRLTLELGGESADACVQIDTAGNVEVTAAKEVSIAAEEAITVNAKSDITIKADGAMNLESGGDLNVKSGGNLNLEAKTNVKTKGGANVDLEGGANVGVSGSGTVEVKGAMIKLN